MEIVSDLLDGLIGGLGGGVLVGVAQMWSYRLGGKALRRDTQQHAIVDLLGDLHFVDKVLLKLPHPESAPAGSPLAYGERSTTAEPMIERLREADALRVPLLISADLRTQIRSFRALCQQLQGPSIDFQVYPKAVTQVREYGQHLQESLVSVLETGQARPAAAIPVLEERPVRR
jgi:hypothetical protein